MPTYISLLRFTEKGARDIKKSTAGSWLGQLVRSLHRYSSDGCIFFILLHSARIVTQRRFAYCCDESGAEQLRLNADGTSPELPGYRIERVPCSAWISAVMLERPLKRGVEGILVIACGDVNPVARDGCQWFEQRMNGQRQPAFNHKEADASRARLIHLDRTQAASLARIAQKFRANPTGQQPSAARQRALQISGAIGLAVVLGAVTWLFSNLPYRTPQMRRHGLNAGRRPLPFRKTICVSSSSTPKPAFRWIDGQMAYCFSPT